MEIQTFEIEEADSGATPQIEAEAVALINTLGLNGQKELVVPKESGATRFQYPEMTKVEYVVYGAVFPQRTRVEAYSGGIIPIRVMQVISHAREYCTAIEVWHKSLRDPDPVLVGIKGDNEYHASFKRFVLARWGDAIKPFKDLILEAREILVERIKRSGEEKIRDGKDAVENAARHADKQLRGEYSPF